MKRKENLIVSSLLALLLVLVSSLDIVMAKNTRKSEPTGKSCPHQEVKEVQGSKISFKDEFFDFGQIPVNRKVTRIFRFQNAGTEPLLLAQHIKSKPIEGC